MIRNNKNARFGAAGLAASVLLTLVLTACGGGGTGGGGGGGAGGGGGGGLTSLPANVQAQVTKVVNCLKGQGVQVPNPPVRRAIRQEIQGLPSAKQAAVLSACGDELTTLRNLFRSARGN